MTFGKWNNTGSLTWTDGNPIWNSDLRDSLYACPPIGAIMPWYKFLTGTPSLPEGWKECDGTEVTDSNSPFNGVNVPDLNNTDKLIMGDSASGSIGGATTHTHTMGNSTSSGQQGVEGTVYVRAANAPHNHTVNSTSNYPQYANVIWILRIK